MGLFIHSNLEAILFHKRLTELERTAEISTGLLVLKQMLDQGQKPADRFETLATLERLLPFIPEHQRDYVLDQIVRPLLTREDMEGNLPFGHQEGDHEILHALESVGASSDFEMEYQITLSRSDSNVIGSGTLFQYEQKKMEEADLREEKIKQRRENQQSQAQIQQTAKLERHWGKLKVESASARDQTRLLRKFLIFHRSPLVQDHPLIKKAKERLSQLESN